MTEPQPDEVMQQMAGWKGKAEYLRGQVKIIFQNARIAGQLPDYRKALEDVRAIQDTMEEYVTLAITAKGSLERGAMAVKDVYDTEWGKAADGKRYGGDMEGPRERYARFDMQPSVFAALRGWRQAEQRVRMASEVLDEMWLRYRAINATRDDLHQIMRTFTIENSLERT